MKLSGYFSLPLHYTLVLLQTTRKVPATIVFIMLFSLSLSAQETIFGTPGEGSFTVPEGVTAITVEAWGGGGAGGISSGFLTGAGGGGAGGSYVQSTITVNPGQRFSLYVAPVTTTGTGNSSWFGSENLVNAQGGNGGGNAGSFSTGSGGAGSVSNSTGDIRFSGGDGANGGAGGGGAGSDGTGGNATGNNGGSGTSAGGGNGGNMSGNPGNNYGGGGAGAPGGIFGSSSNGAGAQGMIIVKYPVISINPPSFDFGPVVAGNISAPSLYNITGINLYPFNGNINVTAPLGFEVSLSQNSGYTSSINVPYNNRTLSSSIYVRFKPTQTDTDYVGQIQHSGGSAGSKYFSVTGTSKIQYCTPIHNTAPGNYYYIRRVKLGDIDNSTVALTSPPYYKFYSDLTTTLMRGEQNEVVLEARGTNSYTNYIFIWLDFNLNGIFEDSERFGPATYTSTSFQSKSIPINVPADASMGNIRMRVRSSFRYQNTHPCNSPQLAGETEDYLIKIVDSFSVDVLATPSCNNANTGTITVNVTGNTGPYLFKLNNGNYLTTNLFTGIASGNHIIYVKDNQDYIKSIQTTIITLPAILPIPEATIVNTTCDDTPDGAIRITNIPTAIQFNSSQTEYVDLGGSHLNNLAQFTIEGWIKINKSQITGSRVWGLFGQNDAIEFGFMNSTTLQLYTVNGGSMDVPINSYFTDPSKWYHIAAVGTGSSLNVYIDGVLARSQNSSTSNYGSSGFNSMLGGRIWDADGNYLNGSMLKAGLWRRALSLSEIQALATGLKNYSSSDASLIAGYNFYEGEGSVISPVGTVTVQGSLKNTPSWVEIFTYQWYKIGTPSFNHTTKNISGLTAGDYLFFAEYPGICPATAIFTVNGASNNSWTGSISTDWFIAGNWSCKVPDIVTDANIPSALQRYPVISSGIASCKNLTLGNGTSLTINGELEIGGIILTTGTINSLSGTVTLKGTTPQVVPAGMFSANTLKNLTINNAAGASLNGTLNISGSVLASNGNLQTNGHLTLLSTSTATGLIDGSGTGQVLGNVTTQRYLAKGNGYKYFSTPFTNGTVGQFSPYVNLSPDVFANFYFYKEDNDDTGWEPYTSGSLIPGKGYAVNFGIDDASKTLSFTGTVNNSTIGPITLSNSQKEFTQGFNLVGNPYPSPIDWNAQGWEKANIDNAIYFFDAAGDDQYLGAYSSYINGISTGNANNIIPALQGFFVHVTDESAPTTGSLTFTNQIRITESNPVFHKNAQADKAPFVKLSASVNQQQADVLAIYFTDFATKSFDYSCDALKIANTSSSVPDLYAYSEDGKELSINAIPLSGLRSEMNLGFTSRESGSASFKLIESVNLPSGLKVYLKDNYTGFVQDMSVFNEYNFDTDIKKLTDRFKLIISSESLAQDVFSSASFNVYAKDGSIFLNLDLSYEQVSVKITDLSGKVISNSTVYGKGEHVLGKFNTTGIFIVSVFSDMGTVSKKVYLK